MARRLMVALLPTGHDSALHRSPPRWRRWAKEADVEVEVPALEREAALDATVAWLLQDLPAPGATWKEVVRALPFLSRPLVERVIAHLEAYPIANVADPERAAMAAELRGLLSRHRTRATATGAPEDVLWRRIDGLLDRYTPEALPERHAWLFTWWPDFAEGRGDDVADYDAHALEAQEAAVRELVASGGLQALLACVRLAPEAQFVGRAAGRVTPLPDETQWLADALGSSEAKVREFANAYIRARTDLAGWDWLDGLLLTARGSWPASTLAAALLSVGPASIVWELAARLGSEVEEAYWRRVPRFLPESAADRDQGVAELLKRDRPFSAIEVLALRDLVPGGVDPELVAKVLEAGMAHRGGDPHGQALDYNVGRLLDFLIEHTEIPRERIARMEFAWSPVFRFGRRPLHALHGQLAKEPTLFVDLVKLAYPPKGDEAAKAEVVDRVLGEMAYHVLQEWRLPPGGNSPPSLQDWVNEARALLARCGRASAGDYQIGAVLSGGGRGQDGVWPREDVRDLIEALGSEDLEQGLRTGLYNSRGVVSRDPAIGGEQERAIADRYEGYASQLAPRWPRTARLLREMAASYREEARHEDQVTDAMQDL